MSRITRDEVERVAGLARLWLSDEEAEHIAQELGTILDYVETLNELDTQDVVPTSHAIALPTPMRDDRAVRRIDPELAVRNAPQALGTAFVVPRVIEGEEEG
jgi:aspartyl-tRNA(Asn)/glutamyl-tRNA(Gln) amidotransferase subunit C